MYTIKPVNPTNLNIEVPDCMYRMKNIYAERSDTTSTATADKSEDNDIVSLEARQQTILEQLKELKLKLMSMHKGLGICVKPAQSAAHKSEKLKISVATVQKPINSALLQDIVINANPLNIPYSLVAVRKQWRNRLNMNVNAYTHSSVSEMSAEAALFSAQFSNDSSSNLPTLTINLIWKNVSSTELICAPAAYVILGEVNILRYLQRIGPNELSDEQNINEPSGEIDSILDACHQYAKVSLVKEKLAVMKTLSSKLGSQQYFFGTKVSVCDIAVSSALKQTSVTIKDLTPNLAKWLKQTDVFYN